MLHEQQGLGAVTEEGGHFLLALQEQGSGPKRLRQTRRRRKEKGTWEAECSERLAWGRGGYRRETPEGPPFQERARRNHPLRAGPPEPRAPSAAPELSQGQSQMDPGGPNSGREAWFKVDRLSFTTLKLLSNTVLVSRCYLKT